FGFSFTFVHMRQCTTMHNDVRLKSGEVKIIFMLLVQRVVIHQMRLFERKIGAYYFTTFFSKMFKTISTQQSGSTCNKYFHSNNLEQRNRCSLRNHRIDIVLLNCSTDDLKILNLKMKATRILPLIVLLTTFLSTNVFAQRGYVERAIKKNYERKYADPNKQKGEDWFNNHLLNVKIEPQYKFSQSVKMKTTNYK